MKKQNLFAFPYPLLIALYPVLYLLASNFGQMPESAALRSLIAAGLLGILLYVGLALLLRSPARAALLASAWLLLFFTYGHVYNLVKGKGLGGFILGRHSLLLVLWAVLALGLGWIILRSRADLAPAGRVLNWVSLALLAVPLLQTGYGMAARAMNDRRDALQAEAQRAALLQSAQVQHLPALPDVYYIILDGHTRSDMLQKYYNFDNRPLLQPLLDMGFKIAECARSNYTYTALSLSATLNMNYLDQIAPDVLTASGDEWSGENGTYVRNSLVRQKFEALGYTSIAFESGYPLYEPRQSNIFYAAPQDPGQAWRTVNNFEALLLGSTLLRAPLDLRGGVDQLGRQVISPEAQQYRRLLYNLEQLQQVPQIAGPKFVFAHITSPHHPYVFSPSGEYLVYNAEDKQQGYISAVTYLDGRIAQIVQTILETSPNPPIIIIQGDHGIDGQTRLEVLNAMYLPGGGDALLYPDISSVNTFRLVFQYYFGENTEFLDDVSYYSEYGTRTQFTVAEPQCAAQP